jgi:hypothetical protein
MTLSTFLRGVTKNSSFLHFRAVFMSYCPQFWGSGVIDRVHDTQYMFERHDQKLIVFAFQGRFCELLPIILGSVEIYKEYDNLYILESNDKKCRFCVYGRFCELLPTVLGWRGVL